MILEFSLVCRRKKICFWKWTDLALGQKMCVEQQISCDAAIKTLIGSRFKCPLSAAVEFNGVIVGGQWHC